MRLRRIKGIEELIKDYSDVIVFDCQLNKGKWKESFNNNNPIYLEIGMGKGNFIIKSAINNPDINYIGCEVNQSITYLASKKIREKGLKNLLVINCDAKGLLDVFEKGEISKIFLNFSDPWPKSRHEKRRLTSVDFLNIYKELLGSGKEIELKSDNQGFFDYSVESLSNNGFEVLELNRDLHKDNDSSIVTTEYEDKFKALNQPIYYVKVRIK